MQPEKDDSVHSGLDGVYESGSEWCVICVRVCVRVCLSAGMAKQTNKRRQLFHDRLRMRPLA